MDEKDLQAIEGLLDKKLQPIKETLDFNTEKLKVFEEKLDSHTAALLNLERDIKSYMDALDVERKRIDKSDERVKVIEDSLGIAP